VKASASQSLKDGDRGTTVGGTRGRLRSWLVTAEIAFALVLLAGAGLLMRTFVNLQHVDMGFNPDHALTFRIQLPEKRYADPVSQIHFYQNLAARLQALPGVQSVGFGSDIPWTGYDENTSFDIVGVTFQSNNSPEARYHFASPDYFRAAGIPLLSGRFFTTSDDAKAPPVVIVNSALAQRYFRGEDAVGKRLDMWGKKSISIVGVIGDIKDMPDAPATPPAFYWADWQFPDGNERVVVLRSTADLISLAAAVPKEVLALDKDLPVTDVKTLDDVGAHAVSTAKFTLVLVGAFAGLAVLLAAIGIFGVISYSVTQRTHEIGIRMALGAQQEDVLGMILRQGAKVTALGVLFGIIGAVTLTRAMRELLYRVSATDPWTFAIVAAVLVAVALAACYIPARRALRVDPIVALRYE
jgi:predicted permease